MENLKTGVFINITNLVGKTDIINYNNKVKKTIQECPEYIIFKDGGVYDYTPVSRYNSGTFYLKSDLILIELEHSGEVNDSFTDKQVETLSIILEEINKTYNIPLTFYKGEKSNPDKFRGIMLYGDIYYISDNKSIFDGLQEKIRQLMQKNDK